MLPAIRKTGGYMVAAPEEAPEELALRAMRVLQDTVDRQKARLAVTEPKAEALDRLADACRALEIALAHRAGQVGGNESFLPPPGLDPQTVIFPEADLYRLVLRSKMDAAERFEEWVTGEVLPAIRKTGGYIVAAPEEGPAELALRTG